MNNVRQMPIGLTIQHKAPRYIIRELRNNPALRHLSQIDNFWLEASLIMPSAVARWIEVFSPELKNKSQLHIVIAGAEQGPDIVDDGRWYQLLPYLLGRPNLVVTVTLLGPDVNISTRGNLDYVTDIKLTSHAPAGLLTKWPPAALVEQTIGQFADHRGLEDIDLIILSHPGFEKYDSWLSMNELGAVLSAGIPVGVASYETVEYEHERWLLDVLGYGATGTADTNPFSFRDDGIAKSAVGHTLWRISNDKLPAENFLPDPKRMEQITYYEQWGRLLFGMDAIGMADEAGQVIALSDDRFVQVLPNLVVDIKTGQASFVRHDIPALEEVGYCVYSEMLPFPESPKFPFEKNLWVAEAAVKLSNVIAYED